MLRVGRLSFANAFPFYRSLGSGRSTDIRFRGGMPFDLNAAMERAELDAAPVSSLAYGRNAGAWLLIRGLAISSPGAARSVLLCQAKGGNTDVLQVPRASETAAAVVQILLRKSGRPAVEVRTYRTVPRAGRFLVFGDEALRLAARRPAGVRILYDVGTEWRRRTGFPCVFAVFVVRREAVRRGRPAVRRLAEAIRSSVSESLRNLPALQHEVRLRFRLPQEAVRDYFRRLRYGLVPEDVRGLRKLLSEAHSAGLLPNNPKIDFAEGV